MYVCFLKATTQPCVAVVCSKENHRKKMSERGRRRGRREGRRPRCSHRRTPDRDLNPKP